MADFQSLIQRHRIDALNLLDREQARHGARSFVGEDRLAVRDGEPFRLEGFDADFKLSGGDGCVDLGFDAFLKIAEQAILHRDR